MNNYEKPVVSVVDGRSEGVYMASGEETFENVTVGGGGTSGGGATCWTASANKENFDGSYQIFHVYAKHSTDAVHIAYSVSYDITFSSPVNFMMAESDFTCTSLGGNVWRVTRNSHANGYKSGDNVSFGIWVDCGSADLSKAVEVTGIKPACDYLTNVQGGNDASSWN